MLPDSTVHVFVQENKKKYKCFVCVKHICLDNASFVIT